jgi:hypothetical protein
VYTVRKEDGAAVFHAVRAPTTETAPPTWSFEPLELLEKLAVLVPPPREHLVLYSGVLAPCASLRDQVVPRPPPLP